MPEFGRTDRFTRVSRGGFSLMELLVVVAIMLILMGTMTGVYLRMSRGQRLISANNRVLGILHQARNLAISYNRVYHVRFHYLPDADGSMNPYVGIYCFSSVRYTDPALGAVDMADPQTRALQTITEPDASDVDNPWSPHLLGREQLEEMIAATPEALRAAKRTALQTQYGNPRNAKQFYNNRRVDRVTLEKGLYLGVQLGPRVPASSSSAAGEYTDQSNVDPYVVLQFRPDGTASASLRIYVTDDPKMADKAPSDLDLSAKRYDAFDYQNPAVKILQVMQGGIIRNERLVRRQDEVVP